MDARELTTEALVAAIIAHLRPKKRKRNMQYICKIGILYFYSNCTNISNLIPAHNFNWVQI